MLPSCQCDLDSGYRGVDRATTIIEAVRLRRKETFKRAEAERHQGHRGRGRPQLRWEDRVRRDL